MKAIHKKRLQKLIAFLRQLPRKRFDFEVIRYGTDCGAVACAIGWTPQALPRLAKIDACGSPILRKTKLAENEQYQLEQFREIAMEVTGLDRNTAPSLFCPRQQSMVDERLSDLPFTATPKQVARMLEKFIELQEAK